ncbi:MAG: hypothetical protein U5M53_02155 [Rhodoferax sp.]|nr:hypothetical protein [Rhodoferax sp.]
MLLLHRGVAQDECSSKLFRTFAVTIKLGGKVDLDSLVKYISALSTHAVVQPLSQLLVDWKQYDRFLYILLALVVGFSIGRYRTYRAAALQNRGEALLSSVAQKNFAPPTITY